MISGKAEIGVGSNWYSKCCKLFNSDRAENEIGFVEVEIQNDGISTVIGRLV